MNKKQHKEALPYGVVSNDGIDLYNGECLEVMDYLISQNIKVDAIITDPPYGTTACKWDTVIPFEEMWKMLYGILRPNGFIVLTASQPFTSKLVSSNINNFSHQWIWEKIGSNGNPLLANKMPLKNFEDILVFSNEYKKYDYDSSSPLRLYFEKVKMFIGLGLKQINEKLGHRKAEHSFYITSTQFKLCTEQTYNELIKMFRIDKMQGFLNFDDLIQKNIDFEKTLPDYPRVYNPQKTKGKAYTLKQGNIGEAFGGTKKEEVITENNGDRYPKSILKFGYCKEKIHPTQKPIALMEYLIKTYTNEGEAVLDFTMGSGTTILAAKNLNRRGIGIELDEKYFNIAKERIFPSNTTELDDWE